jgi:hypothetical protein
MGADIYLNSVFGKCQEEWEYTFNYAVSARNAYRGSDKTTQEFLQKQVSTAYDGMYAEGYFRDSYNSTSLFGLLGLSWWRDVPLRKDGFLSIRNAERLLRKLEKELAVSDERFHAWCDKCGSLESSPWDRIDFSGPGNDQASWRKMFEEKHADLCKLLRQSIELKEPLQCSV